MTDNLDMHDRIVLYGYSGDGSRELSPHELLQVYPPAEIDQNLLDRSLRLLRGENARNISTTVSWL